MGGLVLAGPCGARPTRKMETESHFEDTQTHLGHDISEFFFRYEAIAVFIEHLIQESHKEQNCTILISTHTSATAMKKPVLRQLLPLPLRAFHGI